MNPLDYAQKQYNQLKLQLRLYQDYQTVFNSPEGKNILHDLLRECRVFMTSQDAVNPHNTAFNEGKRSVGLFIQSRLRMDNVPAMMSLLQEKAPNDNQRPNGDTNARPEYPEYRDDSSPILS